jgi:hypothetical protein
MTFSRTQVNALLYEHLFSQHPAASLVVKSLAENLAMPARMWRYGTVSTPVHEGLG